jgi:hypothetical protein
MKHQSKPPKVQLNLALRHPVPTQAPAGKERELALALAELLLTAADEVSRVPAQTEEGGNNESKVDS